MGLPTGVTQPKLAVLVGQFGGSTFGASSVLTEEWELWALRPPFDTTRTSMLA